MFGIYREGLFEFRDSGRMFRRSHQIIGKGNVGPDLDIPRALGQGLSIVGPGLFEAGVFFTEIPDIK
jgi:hypothetical protein